ncbi:MAG: DNA/RNA non-specific endonuclease, partial [Bacteroidota bacterium]
MAKFRSNHRKTGNAKSTITKIISLVILLIAGGSMLLQKYYDFADNKSNSQETNETRQRDYNKYPYAAEVQIRDYLPTESSLQVIHHRYYSLAYSEKHEQAKWVAYELSRDQLNQPKVPRAKRFETDYDVHGRSAYHRDYSGSGYTRGHLAPAADMAFNQTAMEESFLMSNMSPQERPFNNGIWRELEEQTRDWARKFKHLYIVVGPVFNEIRTKIGKETKVSVPEKFYKVILDLSEPEIKGIGFIIPNKSSEKHLHDYALSIDEVEEITGINFFASLLDDQQESNIESDADPKLWKVNKNRFEQRVTKWNN